MIVWIKGNNVYSFLLSSNLVFKIFYILICVFIFDILLDLNISEFDVMFVWWRSSIKRLVFFLSKIVGFVFVDLMVVRVINILVLVFVCFVLIFFFIILFVCFEMGICLLVLKLILYVWWYIVFVVCKFDGVMLSFFKMILDYLLFFFL